MAIDDQYSQKEIKSVLYFKEERKKIELAQLSKDKKDEALEKLFDSPPFAYPRVRGGDLIDRATSDLDHFNTNQELIISCPGLVNLSIEKLKALLKPSVSAALPLRAVDNSQKPQANMSTLPESKQPQTLAVNVVSHDKNTEEHKNFIPSAVEKYNQISKLESSSSYKPGYVQPEVVEGGVQFKFPDAEKSLQFMQALADGKGSFFVLDKDKKVMAYSTGDGTLYKADGRPYEKGAKLESSNVTQADVEERLSEEKPSSSMRR